MNFLKIRFFWETLVFMHDKLMIPTQCNPLYEGQKLGVVLHQLQNSPGLLHFDPSIIIIYMLLIIIIYLIY